ncbi:MAG: long-chain fatty acid--CoA ligase [Solirubrobacteraceae bacterium]|nr:long-chain fatty acid--CoA ligase [Solirubrobacteraceae bacterium]
MSTVQTSGLGVPAGLAHDTLTAAFAHQVTTRPDAPALRDLGGDDAVTWAAYDRRARWLAAGLAARGVAHGDAVGLMLTNRVEFHLLDVAVLLLGGTPFSVYNTSSAEQLEYLFGNAGNRVVLAESRFADVIRAAGVADDDLIVIDAPGGGDGSTGLTALEAAGERHLADGFDLDAAIAAVSPDDVATLIYTSGTTGPPKGVELTHANLIADWRSVAALMPTREGGRLLSYLPCAHLADRFISHYGAIGSGACITCVPDPTRVLEALVETRPTMFAGVPRIWEKLQAALAAKARATPPLQAAIDAGPASTDPAHVAVRDALLEQLGFDQLDWAGSGAAPIAAEVLDFFAAIGLPISEVWGMSEVGCVGTANPMHDLRYGTVGVPLPGIEVRLADDGELLLRGPNVMKGYRGMPEKTAEALDADGWMHTGDVATIDDDGYVTIVDRKKELIINAAGKNMSPANIERALKGAGPLIGQACVIGDRRPYNVALLVLDPDGAAGLDPDDPDVRARVDAEVAAANARLSRVEQIKRYALLSDEWLPDGEELTPTMKLKRRGIADKYGDVIEGLYADG